MNSLSETFARCKAADRKVLIPYLTAAFPDEKTFVRLLHEFVSAGADMVEIGIPFSDPLADGPAIQYASHLALANGVTVERTFRLLKSLNGLGPVPRILLSYYNPIHSYGLERFVDRARAAGISGLIIPDLVWEEGREIERTCRSHDLHLVYLLARTSPPSRRRQIIAHSRGFVYLVSVNGVTGARTSFPPGLLTWVKQVRKESPLPVCVGFGISNPAQARKISTAADGAIIGSAIIDIIRQVASPRRIVDNVGAFLRRIRRELDHA